MDSPGITFNKAFEALTGHTPLRWQKRLYERLLCHEAEIPAVCDLPTGLGKTSVIPIWLIALIGQALENHVTLPRRLAYIVNRRTVVDQATNVVDQIRSRLPNPMADKSAWPEHQETLQHLDSGLRLLSAEPPLLAVSTLRGELADNEEWKIDPARPAVIVGTIDMIGSKLLFSGYGDGSYKRTHNAGIIGQDTLIVHDEAHLTPAFSSLLCGVAAAQAKDGELRPIRVMELSATQRGDRGCDGIFGLEPEDEQDGVVVNRIDARKFMRLHLAPQGKDTHVQLIVDLAHAHDSALSKVLIYVRSPEDAGNVATALKKKLGTGSDDRVALLTGTIRGYERDRLVTEDPVYGHLLNPEMQPSATVYLVSTSAGEVGIDIDADHMVCDLTTLDSMVQRLGRVNRRGGDQREAQIDVVWEEKEENPGDRATEFSKASAKTLAILQEWANASAGVVDASPRNVRRLIQELDSEDRTSAFAPEPEVLPVTDIVLDAWSLTSVDDMPARPQVAPFLHGQTSDPPETYVAWRSEVSLFSKYGLEKGRIRDWFDACRIHSKERLRESTGRVRRQLGDMLKEHDKDREGQGIHIILLDGRGRAEMHPLSEVANDRNILDYKTVVLPVEAGGLTPEGTLDAKTLPPCPNIDVADSDEIGEIRRQRLLYRSGELLKPLLSEQLSEPYTEMQTKGWQERERVTLKEPGEDVDTDEGALDLVLLAPEKDVADDDPGIAKFHQRLDEHTRAIAQHMDGIGSRLGLEPQIKSALVSAAIWHDKGKDREIWQYYACNEDGREPLAKSNRYRRPRVLAGYRHEFGSLLDAMRDSDLAGDPERDLILHIIAAHHGHARPHFETRAFDKDFTTAENEQAAIEVMQRFGRLQKRFGRWGLAWLESLMRCADIAASQPPDDSNGSSQDRIRPNRSNVSESHAGYAPTAAE